MARVRTSGVRHDPVAVEAAVTGDVVAYLCKRCLEPCSPRQPMQRAPMWGARIPDCRPYLLGT
jgi:hypothetical protein